jgi:hypothetical protein
VDDTSVLSRSLFLNNANRGVAVPGDPGIPGANINSRRRVLGISSDSTGNGRFIKQNFAIDRTSDNLPLPGTAETLGKSIQG